MTSNLGEIHKLEADLEQARTDQSRLAACSPKWAAVAEAAREAQGDLVKITALDAQLESGNRELSVAKIEIDRVTSRRVDAETLLTETTSVGWLLRTWRGLPSPEKQMQVVRNLRAEERAGWAKTNEINRKVSEVQNGRAELALKVDAFLDRYSGDPDAMLRKADAHAAKLAQLQPKIKELMERCTTDRRELEDVLQLRLTVLREWPVRKVLSAAKCSASSSWGRRPHGKRGRLQVEPGD